MAPDASEASHAARPIALPWRSLSAACLRSLPGAPAHDWYPLECCSDRDCAPADTVERRDGWQLSGDVARHVRGDPGRLCEVAQIARRAHPRLHPQAADRAPSISFAHSAAPVFDRARNVTLQPAEPTMTSPAPSSTPTSAPRDTLPLRGQQQRPHDAHAGGRLRGQGRPCLLLLHGFPELAYSWRKVMLPLAAAGYHVVAPDQRGYGRTTGWDATTTATSARSASSTWCATRSGWSPRSAIARWRP